MEHKENRTIFHIVLIVCITGFLSFCCYAYMHVLSKQPETADDPAVTEEVDSDAPLTTSLAKPKLEAPLFAQEVVKTLFEESDWQKFYEMATPEIKVKLNARKVLESFKELGQLTKMADVEGFVRPLPKRASARGYLMEGTYACHLDFETGPAFFNLGIVYNGEEWAFWRYSLEADYFTQKRDNQNASSSSRKWLRTLNIIRKAGSNDTNVYRNDALGFDIKLPDHWQFATESEKNRYLLWDGGRDSGTNSTDNGFYYAVLAWDTKLQEVIADDSDAQQNLKVIVIDRGKNNSDSDFRQVATSHHRSIFATHSPLQSDIKIEELVIDEVPIKKIQYNESPAPFENMYCTTYLFVNRKSITLLFHQANRKELLSASESLLTGLTFH